MRCPGPGRPDRSSGSGAGLPADPRSGAQPAAGGETALALGSLLAAKRGIVLTSAIVWLMLKGQGPHQVPTGSTFGPRLVPGAGRGQLLRGEEKTRSFARGRGDRVGTGTAPRIVSVQMP